MRHICTRSLAPAAWFASVHGGYAIGLLVISLFYSPDRVPAQGALPDDADHVERIDLMGNCIMVAVLAA